MRAYRFLVKDYDGFSHSFEEDLVDVDAAIERAKEMVMDVNFVESVTLYSLLSDGSCGPIKYIGEYRYGDL